jgi:hypothetical protein
MREFLLFMFFILGIVGGENMERINLPSPDFKGNLSVEEALKKEGQLEVISNSL